MLKKLGLILLLFSTISTGQSYAAETPPTVFLDGGKLEFEVPPTIVDGTTLVPLRKIFEEQGAQVAWNADTRTVTAVKGDITIVYQIGSLTAKRNQEQLKLSVPGQIVSGSTLVPLRFVSEALGNTVGWESHSKTIIISAAKKFAAKVIGISDGDTLTIDREGTPEKVRLIGVDSPESVHPDATKYTEYGKIASAFSKAQLENKTVYIETDIGERDQYGRLLAYVYLDSGMMYNALLAAEGHATQLTYQPNVRWVNLFGALAANARSADIGLWAYDNESGSIVTGTNGKVTITSLDYTAEIVTIRNDDSKDINMTGWKLVSVKGNQVFNFPDGYLLKKGSTVSITSGTKAKEADGFLKWTTANVHNNNEDDPAELYDMQDNMISSFE